MILALILSFSAWWIPVVLSVAAVGFWLYMAYRGPGTDNQSWPLAIALSVASLLLIWLVAFMVAYWSK